MSDMRLGTLSDVKRPFPLHDGKMSWSSPIINAAEMNGGAHAFLIEQEPASVVRPHFHRTSQFQVVVAGNGSMGRHALEPVTIHYAEGHTGYGPIVAGPEGLFYMTLRPLMEPLGGPLWMPENRNLMEMRERRQATSHTHPVLPDDQRPQALTVETMLEPDETGLAAWFIRLPPDTETLTPSSANGKGRFHVVVKGSARVSDRELPRLGTSWVPPEMEEFRIRAGEAGLEMVVLQFPANSWQQ